jgi:hypothetical protein
VETGSEGTLVIVGRGGEKLRKSSKGEKRERHRSPQNRNFTRLFPLSNFLLVSIYRAPVVAAA